MAKKAPTKTIKPKEMKAVAKPTAEDKLSAALPPNMPKLPPEVEKKLKELKDKLDKFKDKVLEKFGDYIVGITLLPPERPPQQKPEEKVEEKEAKKK